MAPLRPAWLVALLSCAGAIVAGGAQAQTVKPRFIVLVDTSGSMAESAATRVRTHGDGSDGHPGCDLDGNGLYDDSKMYQAKQAINDTVSAFGSVEFSLARYKQNELGQMCAGATECTALNNGSNSCVDGRCANSIPQQSPDYNECSGGAENTNGCVRCADPDNDPIHVWYNGNTCCPVGSPRSNGGYGMAGDVVVPFPVGGTTNYAELLSWTDGKETFPAGNDKELRAAGTTPIGGSLNAMRDWLINDASGVGAQGGILNRDPQVSCRSYAVILITDGLEVTQCANSCGLHAARAAELLYHACTNDGIWDSVDSRCEIDGNPGGTTRIPVKTYVVGFTVDDPSLNAIASAGGTGNALTANNQAELTARLGDIVSASIPTERCDCQDNTCDGAVDESFPTKGQDCSVGVGRCKRAGQLGCKPDGSGLVCSSTPAGMCPAAALVPGEPATEICGVAPGCLAPTADDCADDDCDGLVDENMSCACASKPELCNGLDDDCNGVVDDVPPVACGLAIGECRPGVTVCVDDGQGGRKTVCMGATAAVPEVCDGKDNDCDGVVDGFGVACYPEGNAGCALIHEATSCGGAPAVDWACVGACQTGLLTCTNGQCGACAGAVTPAVELACDTLDNDCDGEVDEGFGLGGPCGPGISGVGECRPGLLACQGSQLRCEGGVGPADEICNGKDDDCDGMVDNLPGTCGVGRGECQAGRWRCVNGAPICDQVQPAAEVCDGKDNDCDGQVDEGVTDPDLVTPTVCGSQVGACRPGLFRCLGGRKICDGGIEPEFERCNGIDDDCDGMIDDSLNPPGACPPPGLPPGSALLGECRPGAPVCGELPVGGVGWACRGGVGPAAEVCDGKDNDCNGVADDGASCADGLGCADGECVRRCQSNGDCPADRLCKDGLCVFAECLRRPCPAGFRCDPRRGCIDRCEGQECPAGTYCDRGVCTSCRATGCAAGQVCRVTVCEPDPCHGKTCPADSYCTDGRCAKSCSRAKCGSGQTCWEGVCRRDACAGTLCAAGEFCDPADGRCRINACRALQCLPGQICVPQTERCVPDPCLVTACRSGEVCVVEVDGRAQCLTRTALAESRSTRVALGGSGCLCALGAGEDGGSGGGPVLALVLAALGRAWRRRRS